jgi:hypothetical protein
MYNSPMRTPGNSPYTSPRTPRTPSSPRTPRSYSSPVGGYRSPPGEPPPLIRNARRRLNLDQEVNFPQFNLDGPPEMIKPKKVANKEIANAPIRYGEECPICSVELKPRSTARPVCEIVGCGHNFHCKCLKKWTEQDKNTCPVCRVPFTEFVQKAKTAKFSFGASRKSVKSVKRASRASRASRKKKESVSLSLTQINGYLRYIGSLLK